MGIAVSLFAGMLLGIVVGIMLAIVGVFTKNWWERRKVIKIQGKENIIAAIKFQQEENKNAITKERTERELGRIRTRDVRDGAGEPNTESREPDTPNQSSTDQRSRVQIPEPRFTLRA